MRRAPTSIGSPLAEPVERLDTAEVRWFASGPLPDSLVDWFIRSGHAALEVRNDSYLVDGSPEVGRKRRDQTTFEVKIRRPSQGLLRLGTDLRGRIEDWQKYIGVRPPVTVEWHSVGKVVLTRTFQPHDHTGLVEVHQRDTAIPGCDIELAAISVEDIQAWTFALEAWGPAGRRHSLLTEAASRFVESSGLPDELTSRLEADMGYPEWLASVVRSPRRATT